MFFGGGHGSGPIPNRLSSFSRAAFSARPLPGYRQSLAWPSVRAVLPAFWRRYSVGRNEGFAVDGRGLKIFGARSEVKDLV